ncbi:MAG TPA: ROK family transcriptional regulator [Vicinamibacterales bacterium]|nr:ROK family transcriptional regulator [Vicinamibacterales bacterium]
MRRINPARFSVATRGTSREINRSIVLNLVRARQPISRADLARTMGIRRGAVSLIVNDLLKQRLIFEGATGETVRGRKPTFLYIDSRRRAVAAADIRASETYVMLADLVGKPVAGVVSIPTHRDPRQMAAALGRRIKSLISEHPEVDACEGLGVVVPGMVEHTTMRVLHAPTLGWQNVDLREPLAAATGLPVQIENSGRACALAQVWAHRDDAVAAAGDLVFVSVSDGIGVGVIIHGEVLRGRHNIAGEFGHVPLSLDGPRCSCGANGCWESYVSNRATLARYFGRSLEQAVPVDLDKRHFTIEDLIARARGNDGKAATALQATARYLGLGLASVINALDPARVYVGGEITLAWDLIEGTVRSALAERTLTAAAAGTDIRPVAASEYPRLLGAAALVAAPAFAAPIVA